MLLTTRPRPRPRFRWDFRCCGLVLVLFFLQLLLFFPGMSVKNFPTRKCARTFRPESSSKSRRKGNALSVQRNKFGFFPPFFLESLQHRIPNSVILYPSIYVSYGFIFFFFIILKNRPRHCRLKVMVITLHIVQHYARKLIFDVNKSDEK